MRLRAKRYMSGTFPGMDKPCISVGNIAWGGRGKSPFCRFLAGMLKEKGLKPVLLTRGYKSRPPDYPHHVTRTDSPKTCGDEPLEFLLAHPDLNVVVDPDRVRGASWAESGLEFDCFILDDGFQHLRMPRDLDIVLLSAFDLGPGWNRVLPAGEWREDKTALKRAHVFAVNTAGSDPEKIRALAEKRLHGLPGETVFFRPAPKGLRRVKNNASVPELTEDYLLIAGISEPERFVSTAKHFVGFSPRATLFFPDHHQYTETDRQKIKKRAAQTGCRHILCTSKDAVKLAPLDDSGLVCLEMGLEMSGEDRSRMERIFEKNRKNS
jgi:tetraacyldisaccharide 4'-kinase